MTRTARIDAAQSIGELRALAARRMPRAVFDFIEGGAEDERTLRANRDQFDRLRLVPRFPVDVRERRQAIRLFGRDMRAPIAVAPMGMTALAWPGTDIAMATACRDQGIAFSLSMAGTASIEAIGAIAGLDRWFQLYPIRDGAFAFALLDRAKAAAFSTLVLTLDCPVGGKRERDRRNGLTVPLRLTRRNIVDVACHPRWLWATARSGGPRLANLPEQQNRNTASSAAYMARQIDPGVDWRRIAAIRDHWHGTLLIKGLLAAADVRAAIDHGADGVILSNHGGRQCDGAPAPLELLADCVAAAAGRAPILCDSGFRRGSDIVQAIALGASAVMVGRACLYGAAAGGIRGATRAIEILIDEIDRTIGFLGITDVADLSPSCLALPWPSLNPPQQQER